LLSGAVERLAQDLVLNQDGQQHADLKCFNNDISRYDLARVLPIIVGSETGAAMLLGFGRPIKHIIAASRNTVCKTGGAQIAL
jgi:hypothetical protein